MSRQNQANAIFSETSYITLLPDPDAVITVEEWRLHSVQSPIALKHEESNEYDHFEPLEFHGHWDNDGEASIKNNGFTGMYVN